MSSFLQPEHRKSRKSCFLVITMGLPRTASTFNISFFFIFFVQEQINDVFCEDT
ncbi:hypothetical protein CpipJ_CPIJ004809 [Culex quinquefasciatus]|uniref:Uncharacterized protein n=1 Tax=Culex quinquefasciatus TaxID=7176 RepID=B0WCI5_CULQU|nr:hypothetical protein CpipJ_CPIJ004809 [Culex quinquefasciatus]|eukprot:XP_001846419.1 hypothetical protein CpipJ_CPIJ004809 [Culex quinquefasciatus]